MCEFCEGGKPLRAGDEVWSVKYRSGPYHVQEIRDDASVCVAETWREFRPKELTHERPDSWERLEEDATLCVNAYRERRKLEKPDGMTWPQAVRADLVRRARKMPGEA